MAAVTGIGGMFFHAEDPEALAAWHTEHLGVAAGGTELFRHQAGPTVFAPFEHTTDYFPADKQWMINLRVDDLGALIARLKAAGIAVETRAEWGTPGYGRFARIHDPEGNPIELWQPPE